MTSDIGYILLSRSIVDSAVFQNEKWLRVWIWCLIEATFLEEKTKPIKTGKGTSFVKIKRGQFVFGRNKHAKDLGMNPSTLWKIILKLESLGNLNIQSSSHYSIITICNYEHYQDSENYKVTGKVTGKGQPSDRQVTHLNKEIKKERKKKEYSEDSVEFRASLFLLNKIRERKPDYKIPNLQQWSEHADYIFRIDKRDPKEVKTVIEWCQKDEFWQNNILSIATLRKQYDKLVLQMNKRQNKNECDTQPTSITKSIHEIRDEARRSKQTAV